MGIINCIILTSINQYLRVTLSLTILQHAIILDKNG